MRHKKKKSAGRKRPPKKLCQMLHFRRRWAERQNGEFADKALMARIKAIIGSGAAKLFFKQSNSVSIYDLTLQDRPVRVVFNTRTRQAITVIPREEEYYEACV